jgi:hypothetical protein
MRKPNHSADQNIRILEYFFCQPDVSRFYTHSCNMIASGQFTACNHIRFRKLGPQKRESAY